MHVECPYITSILKYFFLFGYEHRNDHVDATSCERQLNPGGQISHCKKCSFCAYGCEHIQQWGQLKKKVKILLILSDFTLVKMSALFFFCFPDLSFQSQQKINSVAFGCIDASRRYSPHSKQY
jgi:hypothetical protein